ncbi:hypothetical protein pipiens_020420, partial [Culex pipiens pipiens]
RREPAPKGTIESDFPKRRFPDLKPSERRIRGLSKHTSTNLVGLELG